VAPILPIFLRINWPRCIHFSYCVIATNICFLTNFTLLELINISLQANYWWAKCIVAHPTKILAAPLPPPPVNVFVKGGYVMGVYVWTVNKDLSCFFFSRRFRPTLFFLRFYHRMANSDFQYLARELLDAVKFCVYVKFYVRSGKLLEWNYDRGERWGVGFVERVGGVSCVIRHSLFVIIAAVLTSCELQNTGHYTECTGQLYRHVQLIYICAILAFGTVRDVGIVCRQWLTFIETSLQWRTFTAFHVFRNMVRIFIDFLLYSWRFLKLFILEDGENLVTFSAVFSSSVGMT